MQIIPIGVGSGHSDKVRILCFDATSENVFSAGWDRTILKWSLSQALQSPLIGSNSPVHLPVLKFIGHQSSISALIYWLSRNILISGDKQGFIFFWNPENGALLAKIKTPHPKITALFLDNPQNILYSGGSDGIIRSWLQHGEELLAVAHALQHPKCQILIRASLWGRGDELFGIFVILLAEIALDQFFFTRDK